MPRYFFDVSDKDGLSRDEVGIDLESMDLAVAEARKALADMTKEALLGDSDGGIAILIRDGDEGPVLLSVDMTTQWPPN